LGVTAMGVLLAAVSWGVLPNGSQAFVDTLRVNAAFSGFGLWNVQNPKVFFALLLPQWPQLHWPLTAVCSFASIAVAWWVKRKSGAPIAVMFPVAVFLSLWASPHALIYEWTLVVAVAVVLWSQFPASRDVWLCTFALVWVSLTIATPLALVQIRQQFAVVVQPSIPVIGVVGWLVARELANNARAVANKV
jgi:hypothetical protein